MKKIMILTIILIFLAGCNVVDNTHSEISVKTVSSINELMFTEQELSEIGFSLGGANCIVEEYETDEHSSLGEYLICNYTIDETGSQVITQLSKYSNMHDLNGSYQYDSSHYYSADGLIGENTYGDQSRFRVNSEHDYMGHLNDPDIFYYHLWITKDLYLIHITSKGVESDKEYVAKMGEMFMSRFE